MRLYCGPLIHPLHIKYHRTKGFHHRPDQCPKHFGPNIIISDEAIKIPNLEIKLMEEQWNNWRSHLIQLPDQGQCYLSLNN